ncbi:hypothetical protein AALA21_07725 [Eggerthellaceae bacterium 3-80]|nr:hypothetical protein D7W09_07455 [bacterium D16-34]
MITREIEEEWERLYEDGLSIRDIAKISGFGGTCVRNHLNKLGIAMRKTTVTPDITDKWVADFQAGKSVADIARESEVNDETVRSHLKKRGIKMRKKGTLSLVTPEMESQWAHLYHTGLSASQIAKRYDIGVSTVATHLKNHGITMRKGYETNRKVTDEIVNEWIDLYENGMGTPQIAKSYGATSTTVLKYLRDHNIKISHGVDKDVSKEISERYLQGESVSELADAYSLSDTSIRNHLKKNNIALRKENRGYYQVSDSEILDWVKRYESGEPLKSIALSAGIKSTEPVRKRLIEHGVKIRSKITPSTSSTFPEWALVYYLSKAFPDCSVENNASLSLDSGTVYPDVLVTGDSIQDCLNNKGGYRGLIVEYDGEHWHDNPEQRRIDKTKTIRMSDSGYYVIRIIENCQNRNEYTDSHFIFCTQSRDNNESGLGFAITAVFAILGKDSEQVNLAVDMDEISKLYYEARNKAAQYNEWVNLYQMGISSIEIADRFDTTPTTVTTHLKAFGVKIRHKSYNQEARNKWLELYRQGMDVPDISVLEQIDKGVIYRYLSSIGVSFDRTAFRPKAHDLEWKKLYENGASLTCIADKYGVSVGKVKSHLEKIDTKIRSQKRPNIKERDIDQWVEEYKDGSTLDEISREHGVGSTTIRSQLIKRGIELRKTAPNKTPDDVLDQMVSMYKQGFSPKEISKQLGLSHSAVCRNLKSMGLDVVSARIATEENVDEWVGLYESGSNINEIAKLSGFNRNTISKRLQSRGVILRP